MRWIWWPTLILICAMRRFEAKNEQDMARVGEEIANMLEAGDVYGLIGELGAGKTTLVRAIVAALGSQAKVKSPTFSIMNEYPVESHSAIKKVQHLDFYRFENPLELEALAMGDWRKDTVTFIEWPDIFEERAFPVRHEIRIEVTKDGMRHIEVL